VLLQDSDDEISHLEWETVRVRFVKAGTLEKLVESLATDDGELESTYINVFLTTYRTFATAKQVLTLLLDRWMENLFMLYITKIFTMTKCNKFFLGYQSHQYAIKI
jgi:hypothetical protein